MKKFSVLFFATGCGLGFSPFAPGTCGSLPGFLLVFLLDGITWYFSLITITILFFLGVWISNLSLEYFKEKDPGSVTIDEIVSLPVTFFLIPLTAKTIILGFVLNRILDIFKPPPAFQAQKLKDGWGIMVDDMISGAYSCILMHVILSVFKGSFI